MTDRPLCDFHTGLVKACIAHNPHMTKRARKRLHDDYRSQCSSHCATAATPQETR